MSAKIVDRLLDSEEHADESAVPQVAYDAVEVIDDLLAALRDSLPILDAVDRAGIGEHHSQGCAAPARAAITKAVQS